MSWNGPIWPRWFPTMTITFETVDEQPFAVPLCRPFIPLFYHAGFPQAPSCIPSVSTLRAATPQAPSFIDSNFVL
eukprot:scaffold57776_cov18-Tisochrysis_lutea.AAC.2